MEQENLKPAGVMDDPLTLSRLRPEWSARVPITRAQRMVLMAGCAVLLLMAAWQPWLTARAFVLVSIFFYVVHAVYKLVLVRFSVSENSEIVIGTDELAGMHDDDLPVYSIMVPMYHERESVKHLILSLSQLDYPAGKLDIQLLLEADDQETRAAVTAITLPQASGSPLFRSPCRARSPKPAMSALISPMANTL